MNGQLRGLLQSVLLSFFLGCTSAPQPASQETDTAVTDLQSGAETLPTDVTSPKDATATVACVSLNCDDDNSCTYDDCDAATGCTHTPVNDDTSCIVANDACFFVGATCQTGKCVPGTVPIVCDNGKACQTATCVPGKGCVYTSLPAGTACDDMDACTTFDSCFADGSCAGQPIVCTGGLQCKSGTCGGTGNGCEFSSSPISGEPGAPCAQNADCDSGFCVDTANGKVCTMACMNCCPNGWQCSVVTAGPTFACVPDNIHSCEPCTKDAQCQSPKDPGGLCISYGDAGSFCGGSCKYDTECAVGYLCQKTNLGTSTHCVKQNGVCDCSDTAVAKGLTTDCVVSNAFGTCSASRMCTASGLTACAAKTPAAEVCNGVDDDCDGAIDEPGATGCTGTPCVCP